MQIIKLFFIIITGAAMLGGCPAVEAEASKVRRLKDGATRYKNWDSRGDNLNLLKNEIRRAKAAEERRVLSEARNGTEEEDTPLHTAAWNNDAAEAKRLIANGAEVNAKGKYGWTPLHRAAEGNAAEVAKLLIEHGADVNAKDNGGWTALYYAAWDYKAEILLMLIDNGADVNAKDNGGQTPLDKAAKNNEAVIKKLLIANGAK